MAVINSIYASYDPISCGYVSNKRDSNCYADNHKSLCLFTSLQRSGFPSCCVNAVSMCCRRGAGRYGLLLLEGVGGGGVVPPRIDP